MISFLGKSPGERERGKRYRGRGCVLCASVLVSRRIGQRAAKPIRREGTRLIELDGQNRPVDSGPAGNEGRYHGNVDDGPKDWNRRQHGTGIARLVRPRQPEWWRWTISISPPSLFLFGFRQLLLVLLDSYFLLLFHLISFLSSCLLFDPRPDCRIPVLNIHRHPFLHTQFTQTNRPVKSLDDSIKTSRRSRCCYFQGRFSCWHVFLFASSWYLDCSTQSCARRTTNLTLSVRICVQMSWIFSKKKKGGKKKKKWIDSEFSLFLLLAILVRLAT